MLVRLVCPYTLGDAELPEGTLVALSDREGDQLVLDGVAVPATADVLTAWL